MDDNHQPDTHGRPVTDHDLEVVVARAAQIWDRTVVKDWLWAANSYLDGARPIDILHLRGPAEVLEALDAAEAGAL